MDTITSPTLLISRSRVRANIQRMRERARRHGLQLIPHFKTHQNSLIGTFFLETGTREIAVTSLRMAREFAALWPELTIAMPVNPREFPELGALAAKVRLTLFIVDPPTAKTMGQEVGATFRYYIEIDAGYGRTGVKPEGEDEIREIIANAGHHQFRGFYVHSGHTYGAESPAEIRQIHEETLKVLRQLRTSFSDMPNLQITIGDTPACSTQEIFDGVDAIGPGNFVYYDLVQENLGSCTADDIAICLAVPVVQVSADRETAIVHGGWTQLGKDQLGDGTYGRIVRIDKDGSRGEIIIGAAVTKLSQEHGTIQFPAGGLPGLKAGDILGILPVHACAMVHGMRLGGLQILTD